MGRMPAGRSCGRRLSFRIGAGSISWQLASTLVLGERECDSMGPGSGLRESPEEADSVDQMTQSAQAGTKLNLLRNFYAGFRSTASGIRRWGLLCGDTERCHLTETEGAALAWPGFVTTGRTFPIYVAQLGIANLPVCVDTRCRTEAGTGCQKKATKVLAKGQQPLNNSWRKV